MSVTPENIAEAAARIKAAGGRWLPAFEREAEVLLQNRDPATQADAERELREIWRKMDPKGSVPSRQREQIFFNAKERARANDTSGNGSGATNAAGGVAPEGNGASPAIVDDHAAIIPPEMKDKLEIFNWKNALNGGDEREQEKPKSDEARASTTGTAEPAADTESKTDDNFLGYWHGEVSVKQSRPWFVHGTIPEVGCGLLSGQWGTYKTFTAKDLAAAAMTGTPIFGSEIDRRGGVLFYAAEGENEVPIRIQAAIEKRCSEMDSPPIDPQRAPFIWLTPEKLPLCLLDPKSVEMFIKRAHLIDAAMMSRFGLPLVLTFIDTIAATAGYKKSGDENDSTLGTRIMREGLGRIGRETRTFTMGTDHFGKDAETATRGTIAKEDNSDVVLVTLGEKNIEGVITNPRLAVRKVRGGVAGRIYPFSTHVVEVSAETTLTIDWAKTEQNIKSQDKPKELPKTAQTALRALREAIDEVGAEPPASNHIPQKTKTVTVDQWRDYAYRRGISTGEDRAKQKAFKSASEHLIGRDPPRVAMWDGQVWPT